MKGNASCRSLAVLGIDGSGKSTVARHLAKLYSMDKRTCLVSDELTCFSNGMVVELPMPVMEHLRKGISSMAKHAHSMKSYKIPKLIDLFLRDRGARICADKAGTNLLVMDGSPLLNMVAWSALYKPESLNTGICSQLIDFLTGRTIPSGFKDPIYSIFPELKTIQRLHLNRLILPDTCLFLDVSPAMACERINARQEHRQVHETEDKLARLREAYLLVCETVSQSWSVNCHVLDAELPLDTVLEIAEQAGRQI